MRTSEIVLLSSIGIAAIVLCYESLEFRYAAAQGFGPGFVPLNFAAATLLLVVLLIVKRSRGDDGSVEGGGEAETGRLKAVAPAIGAVTLLLVATLVMSFGSVLAPLFAAMVVVSAAMLGHAIPRALALNALTVAVVYAVFNLWLGIPVG